jgi:hypothetical protein
MDAEGTLRYGPEASSSWEAYQNRVIQELDAHRNHAVYAILCDLIEAKMLLAEERCFQAQTSAEAEPWRITAVAYRDLLKLLDKEVFWRSEVESRKRLEDRRKVEERRVDTLRSAGRNRFSGVESLPPTR